MEKEPNVDQLRHDIDSGSTGDKVDFPDPAAAPLGTDAEAGGFPPSPAELQLEAVASATTPQKTYVDRGLTFYIVAAVSVGVFIVLALILAR